MRHFKYIVTMANNFESCGAHLRNLLSPYKTLLTLLKDIKTKESRGEIDDVEKLKTFLFSKDFDNLEELIKFSHIEEMESANWRDSEHFKM